MENRTRLRRSTLQRLVAADGDEREKVERRLEKLADDVGGLSYGNPNPHLPPASPGEPRARHLRRVVTSVGRWSALTGKDYVSSHKLCTPK